jgi:hypothetical protein
MIGGIIVLILTAVLSFLIVDSSHLLSSSDKGLLKRIFFYHVLLSMAYYFYVLYNPTDSRTYYNSAVQSEGWVELYGTSTTFVKFLVFPFVKYLSFSYEASMALFSFFGFLGFFYFFITFRENIRYNHSFLGTDLVILIFFLPNFHFWTGSLGKGSLIFLGIALFFFGVSHVGKRWLLCILGGVLVYHVRPHIMLVILVSYAIAFVFTSRQTSSAVRVLFLIGSVTAFFFIYQDVLTLVGIDEDLFITQGLDLTHRASELSKATSGVNITDYSLPFQVFTFLYRPLFFDAPGILGLFVSFENIFYLLITFKLVSSWNGWRFMALSNFLVKGALLSFLSISLALAQISGNLGLAIRQKSQVMMLLMFVTVSFLDQQKMVRSQNLRRRIGLKNDDRLN